jgi:D-alanine-D-alanine ligase
MKIAVVFGGQSFEHEISIVSAMAMKEVIDHELLYVFVDAKRDIFLIPSAQMKSTLFSSGDYKKMTKLTFEQGGFSKKTLFGSQKVDVDMVLNLAHGGDGEDGKLANLFAWYNIPFIGPRSEACSVSFNKVLTKMYAAAVGVKMLPYVTLFKGGDRKIEIPLPVIIKPARLGSSIGVGIVKDQSELDYALDVAFEFDDTVIVEPFIAGVKEYNQAGSWDKEMIYSIIEEPHKNEFLDFDKKYLDFNRTSRVSQAEISDELANEIRQEFKKLYEPFFKGSIIRCDFFVIDGEVFLNEINPIPGSMANYLFDDFNSVITRVANNQPSTQKIDVSYAYLHSLRSAKGK